MSPEESSTMKHRVRSRMRKREARRGLQARAGSCVTHQRVSVGRNPQVMITHVQIYATPIVTVLIANGQRLRLCGIALAVRIVMERQAAAGAARRVSLRSRAVERPASAFFEPTSDMKKWL